jgi:nitroreductase
MNNIIVVKAKSFLYKIPGMRNGLKRLKKYYKRVGLSTRFKSYRKDIIDDWKYLTWHRTGADYWKLSSELIFYYHKLEKGLCLPPEKQRWFGYYPAVQTMELLNEWDSVNLPKEAPVYQAACATLKAYYQFAEKFPNDNLEVQKIKSELNAFLVSRNYDTTYSTPIPLASISSNSFDVLQELASVRRSTRNFNSKPVEIDIIKKAVQVAQLSPSACNRQPWKLHIYEKREIIDQMLALQNGNSGFGHKIPLLAVMCCDLGSFFDSTERHEAHLDGGLFLMSFIYAIQTLGLSSCCLNWCTSPEIDHKAHTLGDIPRNERILTFLAIGYPETNTIVPLSARRPLDDVLITH